ncbi:MAG: diacylglyceryl transferase [Rhizobiales bacterium]|nr:diacylglyceryl transferase [Hyphomicrobiales bacterium]
MLIHTIFDILAALCALTLTAVVYRWRLAEAGERIERLGLAYAAALVGGAVAGGYLFGTVNLWLTGIDGVGRSIAGALIGAIAGVETFKAMRGVRGSTGLLFVPAFCLSVAIGRIGCFLSGLEDQTHGSATGVPWAHDYGDGVLRHPVQIYEALAMAGFLVFALVAIGRRDPVFMRQGFYLMAGWYGAQRFLWEFFKPYGPVLGPLNIFHFVCAGLLVYAFVMLHRSQREYSSP